MAPRRRNTSTCELCLKNTSLSRACVRSATRLSRHRVEHLIGGRRLVEGAERGQRLARGHLFGGALGAAGPHPPDAIAKGDLRGVLAAMARTRGSDDFVLRR